jgi:hypothetical protein
VVGSSVAGFFERVEAPRFVVEVLFFGAGVERVLLAEALGCGSVCDSGVAASVTASTIPETTPDACPRRSPTVLTTSDGNSRTDWGRKESDAVCATDAAAASVCAFGSTVGAGLSNASQR